MIEKYLKMKKRMKIYQSFDCVLSWILINLLFIWFIFILSINLILTGSIYYPDSDLTEKGNGIAYFFIFEPICSIFYILIIVFLFIWINNFIMKNLRKIPVATLTYDEVKELKEVLLKNDLKISFIKDIKKYLDEYDY